MSGRSPVRTWFGTTFCWFKKRKFHPIPPMGIEPMTTRLKVWRSAAELRGPYEQHCGRQRIEKRESAGKRAEQRMGSLRPSPITYPGHDTPIEINR